MPTTIQKEVLLNKLSNSVYVWFYLSTLAVFLFNPASQGINFFLEIIPLTTITSTSFFLNLIPGILFGVGVLKLIGNKVDLNKKFFRKLIFLNLSAFGYLSASLLSYVLTFSFVPFIGPFISCTLGSLLFFIGIRLLVKVKEVEWLKQLILAGGLGGIFCMAILFGLIRFFSISDQSQLTILPATLAPVLVLVWQVIIGRKVCSVIKIEQTEFFSPNDDQNLAKITEESKDIFSERTQS